MIASRFQHRVRRSTSGHLVNHQKFDRLRARIFAVVPLIEDLNDEVAGLVIVALASVDGIHSERPCLDIGRVSFPSYIDSNLIFSDLATARSEVTRQWDHFGQPFSTWRPSMRYRSTPRLGSSITFVIRHVFSSRLQFRRGMKATSAAAAAAGNCNRRLAKG